MSNKDKRPGDRLKRLARRGLGGAMYGFGLVWGIGAAYLYSPLAWVAIHLAMLVSAFVAGVCAVFSGE